MTKFWGWNYYNVGDYSSHIVLSYQQNDSSYNLMIYNFIFIWWISWINLENLYRDENQEIYFDASFVSLTTNVLSLFIEITFDWKI